MWLCDEKMFWWCVYFMFFVYCCCCGDVGLMIDEIGVVVLCLCFFVVVECDWFFFVEVDGFELCGWYVECLKCVCYGL